MAGGDPETGQMMPILGPNGKPLNLNAFFGSDFFSQLESEEMDFVHTFLSQLGDLDDDQVVNQLAQFDQVDSDDMLG